MVKGAVWAAIAQPLILGFGAVLATLDLNVLDIDTAAWGKWKIFKSVADGTIEVEEEGEDEMAPEADIDATAEKIDESELTDMQKKIKDPLDKSIKDLGLDDIIPEDE